MSYDVSLILEHDNAREEVWSDNYTYNCGSMFRAALGGDGIYDLDGVNAADARMVLFRAIGTMISEPEKYRAMNPANGWGSYEGALNFLWSILRACVDFPAAKIEVS